MVKHLGHVLPTPALALEFFVILYVHLGNITVIKLVQFLPILNIAVVVTTTSLASVHHHPPQPVLSQGPGPQARSPRPRSPS